MLLEPQSFPIIVNKKDVTDNDEMYKEQTYLKPKKIAEEENKKTEFADGIVGGRDLRVLGHLDFVGFAEWEFVYVWSCLRYRLCQRACRQLWTVATPRGVEAYSANHTGLCRTFT